MDRNRNLRIIIFCLVCVIILPFTTLLYMRQEFTIFSVIALIVNILCIPVVIICLIKEKNNNFMEK